MEDIKSFNKIKEDLPIRFFNLTKYYPFFELNNAKPINDKYDVGYLSLSVISFMLHEGKLLEKGLSFEQIQRYLKRVIYESYYDDLEEFEVEEITRKLLRMMTNKGDHFNCSYIDTSKNQKVNKQIKYITRTYDKLHDAYTYKLTSEAVDFFLMTKEFGEESKVTVTLLLLRKLVDSENFESAIGTIANLNIEIKKEIQRKNEIIEELSYNIYDGYAKYTDNARERFEEEQQLFNETMNSLTTIEKEYLEKIEKNQITEKEMKLKKYVTDMKLELGKSVELHSKLLGAIVDLRKKADEILTEKRKNILKENFNFVTLLEKSISHNSLGNIERLMNVLFLPKIKKEFAVNKIDDISQWRKPKIDSDTSDLLNNNEGVRETLTLDVKIDDRIINNFSILFKELLEIICNNDECNINMYFDKLYIKYGMESLLNADLITFILKLTSISGVSVGSKVYNYDEIKESNFEPGSLEQIYCNTIDMHPELQMLKTKSLICELQKGENAVFDLVTVSNFKYYLD